MSEFKEGLYDELITQGLRQTLHRLAAFGLRSTIADLEETDCPDYLARHLIRQVRLALRSLSADDRKRRQVELTNSLLEYICNYQQELLEPDPIDPRGEILQAIHRSSIPPASPSTPLSVTNLLMNAQGEPRLGFELEREMASADAVYMVVSFIQWRGWQRLKNMFQELADHNVPVRALTTTYIGATDFRAVKELAQLPTSS